MKKHLPSLNGLRAISVLLVIFLHCKAQFGWNVSSPFDFFFDGNLGVNIFFIISGFLITKLLLIEETGTGKISLRNFYRRRILRIFPAYYFLLIVYGVFQSFHIIQLSRISWLTSIFFIKYFAITDIQTMHFWSLSVEEHFYLLYPICFMYGRKYITRISFAVILLTALIRLISYKWHVEPFTNPLSLFHRADALVIGCMFGLHEEKIHSFTDRIVKKITAPALIFIIIAGIYLTYSLSDINTRYHLHIGYILIPFGTTTGTISNFLVGLLIIVSINYRTAWFRFLNHPAMEYIGKLSYSLYLWEQIFIFSPAAFGTFTIFPINLLVIFAAANFSYYMIERPFLRLRTSRQPAISFAPALFTKRAQ